MKIRKGIKVMPDGTKLYFNKFTGEIIEKKNIFEAIKYFKADGKVCHYTVRVRDIKRFKHC